MLQFFWKKPFCKEPIKKSSQTLANSQGKRINRKDETIFQDKKMMRKKIKKYISNMEYNSKPVINFQIWLEMSKNLVLYRELTWRFFVRSFATRYRQTILGLMWTIITPVAAIGAFLLLNRAGIFNIGGLNVPYPIYAFAGLTIWQIFASGLNACSGSISGAGSMITKIKFPLETLVISSMGQTILDTLIRIVFLIFLFIHYRFLPPYSAIYFPVSLLPMLLFVLGLGFLFSLLNVFVRDVSNILTIGTTFMLFLTPVLYPAPRIGTLTIITKYNPLATLVNGSRDLLIGGKINDLKGYIVSSFLSLFLFLLFWRLFYISEARVAERIGIK